MTKDQIKNYLNKPCNYDNVRTLRDYIMNDSYWAKLIVQKCVEFANKKIKEKKFDKILFVQCVYNYVDIVSKNQRFLFDYYYRFDDKFTATKIDKYHVAFLIAQYIESNWLRM